MDNHCIIPLSVCQSKKSTIPEAFRLVFLRLFGKIGNHHRAGSRPRRPGNGTKIKQFCCQVLNLYVIRHSLRSPHQSADWFAMTLVLLSGCITSAAVSNGRFRRGRDPALQPSAHGSHSRGSLFPAKKAPLGVRGAGNTLYIKVTVRSNRSCWPGSSAIWTTARPHPLPGELSYYIGFPSESTKSITTDPSIPSIPN